MQAEQFAFSWCTVYTWKDALQTTDFSVLAICRHFLKMYKMSLTLQGSEMIQKMLRDEILLTVTLTVLFLSKLLCVFLNNFIDLFIFACAGSSVPCRPFSGCGEQRVLSRCSAQASHCSGFSCEALALGQAGFSSWGSPVLEHGSMVVVHSLSYSAACGISPNQGANPSLLHWLSDSLSLSHPGSPNW